MKRPLILGCLAVAMVTAVTCAPPADPGSPVMYLTPRPRTIEDTGQTTTIQAYVGDSKGGSRTGSVTLTAAAGAFKGGGKTTTFELGEGGIGSADYACSVAADPDCTGSVRIEARWEQGSEFLVQVARIAVGPPDAGSGPDPVGFLRSGVLQKYVGPTIWTNLSRVAAVDSQNRLYVTDGDNVYRVEGGTPSIYLASADLPTDAGILMTTGRTVIDLDVGSDDQLYVLLGEANSWIARSSAAHQVSLVTPTNHFGFSFNLSVATPDRYYVASGYDGLLEVTSDGGSRILYSNIGVSDCAAPDLTALPNFFFYTPGCNGSPIYGGKLNGAGAGVVKNITGSSIGFGRAAIPDSVVALDQGVPRIIYVHTDGGSLAVTTTPTLAKFATMQGGTFLWNYFDLVQGPTGTIYMVSGPDILSVSGVP